MELAEFFQNIKTPATILHVLGVVVGMGSALASDGLFSFFAKDKKLNKTEISTLSILSKIVFYSLILITVSGVAVFLSDPEKYMDSIKFMAKMSILAVLLINGFVLNKYVWPHLITKNFFTVRNERGMRKLAFACGAISVVSWLSVFVLGMLPSISISYGMIIAIYFLIILFGISVALAVEKKEFN
jgi:hypothetical protein